MSKLLPKLKKKDPIIVIENYWNDTITKKQIGKEGYVLVNHCSDIVSVEIEGKEMQFHRKELTTL